MIKVHKVKSNIGAEDIQYLGDTMQQNKLGDTSKSDLYLLVSSIQ